MRSPAIESQKRPSIGSASHTKSDSAITPWATQYIGKSRSRRARYQPRHECRCEFRDERMREAEAREDEEDRDRMETEESEGDEGYLARTRRRRRGPRGRALGEERG